MLTRRQEFYVHFILSYFIIQFFKFTNLFDNIIIVIFALFVNVPLDETIAICTQALFESESTVFGLNKKEITEMLSLTTKESIILFDKEFYSQIDTVAMGSR